MANDLLRSWRALKRNGYTRSDRHYLLRIIGRSRDIGAAGGRCGWPALPNVRHDRQFGDRDLAAAGKAMTAAIAAGDYDVIIENLQAMRKKYGNRPERVLRRMPQVVRDEVKKCSRCGGFHRDDAGDDYDNWGRICSDCLDAHFFTCVCDCTEHRDNGSAGPDDVMYCESCFNGQFCHCAGCDGAFLRDDCYGAEGGRYVCSDCSESWYLWESDGLYHRRDTDPLKVRRPNQGADESGTVAHKWLVERAAAGVVSHATKDEYISNDGIYAAFEGAMKVTGLTYGIDDYVDGMNGPDAMLREMESGVIQGRGLPWRVGRLTFPKRVAKWFKDHLPHRKITDAQAGAIGDAARAHCPKPVPWFWEIKSGPFDWKKGDFGDPNSCYWSCHTYARMQLNTQHNAFAFRLWSGAGDDRRGLGRCWILCVGGAVLLWNAYGPYTLDMIARHVGNFISKGWADPKKIKLTNDGGGGGWLYINNAAAFAIAPDGVSVPEHIELGWKQ